MAYIESSLDEYFGIVSVLRVAVLILPTSTIVLLVVYPLSRNNTNYFHNQVLKYCTSSVYRFKWITWSLLVFKSSQAPLYNECKEFTWLTKSIKYVSAMHATGLHRV